MVIKDTKGKYEIRVEGTICHEIVYGILTKEDVERVHNDYVTKIFPMLKGKRWAKLCDAREYKPYLIVDLIRPHVEECLKNGLSNGCIVTSSKSIEINIRRGVTGYYTGREATGGADDPKPFKSVEEARQWLKDIGYSDSDS